jgi:hypothetical protein
LPLDPSQIEALHRACEAMADAPRDATFDHFAIAILPEAAAALATPSSPPSPELS